MTTWFLADTHFGHANIIKYSNRPFASKEEMDTKMIENWNKKVGVDDDVYHIGDFCFMDQEKGQSILDRLNGRKHLVLGNHDKVGRRLKGWEWIKDYHEMTIDGQFIVLCHYAMRVWNRCHKGSIQLFGHSHGNLPGNSQQIDVGVDVWDYQPVTLKDVQRKLKTLPAFHPEDHHGK